MRAIQAYAAEINSHHEQATKHAGIAIDHAKKAGELLLRVKDELKHGEFLPWIKANCSVTARQAQRYMRAAQGKPITPREIKYDTVSHLLDGVDANQAFARRVKELRERAAVLEQENDALKASRDTYMTQSIEMQKQLDNWKRRAEKVAQ